MTKEMFNQLEQRVGGRDNLCALLGSHEQSYYNYRKGDMPEYIKATVWAHMQLSNTAIKRRSTQTERGMGYEEPQFKF